MDFEAFKDYGFHAALAGFLMMVAYWAKSTRDDLKENDKKLATDLNQHKVETNHRIVKVEESLHQNQVILTEIKGDLKLLNSNVQIYKKEKHNLENEITGFQGAMPEILRALTIAERLNERNEKK